MLRRGSAFIGYSIEATDGKVGTVSDLLFDESSWHIRWLVADTGGWLRGRRILIHPSSLDAPDVQGRAFPAKLTRAQVEASPNISSDEPVSLQMEHDLSAYYGWSGGALGGSGISAALFMPMPTEAALADGARRREGVTHHGDPHLRSFTEVVGYAIHAVDDSIGHLDTFIIEDTDWTLRYLVVDTANWWPGKHVLVAPAAVKEIDWAQRFVRLDQTCYKIKGSPSWDGTGLIDRAYEALLNVYYGWGTEAGATRMPAVPTKETHAQAEETAA
jgi:hypothetical protein